MTVQCATCGERLPMERMILRRLNGRSHFCCSIRCEVRWEKLNLVGICG